ncbi:TetR/AcrR family transcriptional regulator [Rhodococcus sp. NPDC056960]|uniref:TetR/AcrR family transcriptional regulator n=1 Tax=Rhodococcus sp. NPDC056960 TaxID=3345982 RepID=UPI003634D575
MASKNGTESRETKRAGKGPGGSRDTVGRDRVMEVALQLFHKNGYSGTSLKAVADELGISPPALYWYFRSKEDLYVASMEMAMENFLNYVRESITDDDPVFKLSQLVRAHVTWQLQKVEYARAFDLTMSVTGLTAEVPENRLAPVIKMEIDYVEQVRSILRDGVDDGVFAVDDIKTTAFAIITLCEYVTTWYNPEGELSVAAVANRYDGLVRRLVGVASRRTAQPDELTTEP